jgi:uncharacterized membrane protein YhiD involved in acid resistance
MNFILGPNEISYLIIISYSFICGLWISYIYTKLDSTLSYEKSFTISLIILTVLTTLVMNAISSSISLSLGLIGALSIVRFRTVLKNTLDMCFIFWCVACGIGFGSGNSKKVLLTSILIGAFLIFLRYFNKNVISSFLFEEFIVSINYRNNLDTKDIQNLLDKLNSNYQLKNSTVNKEDKKGVLIYSIKLKAKEFNYLSNLQTQLKEITDIEEVSIFKPQNEINI